MSNKAVPQTQSRNLISRVPLAFERTLLPYERRQTNEPDFEKMK